MSQFACPRTESTHHRLYDFAKMALIKIFAHPYATVSAENPSISDYFVTFYACHTFILSLVPLFVYARTNASIHVLWLVLGSLKVCDLYCGGGADADKWDEAQIGHYIGIDESSSGISLIREAWESKRKAYTAEFFEVDPCTENVEIHLQEKANMADFVCCLQHLQLCFENEEKAQRLLHNVSSLLKPGGYFFGITPDSSTIWAKYQKNVEAYHNKSSSMKPNIVPNCIRTENYMITFEVEEEKFPLFGKKYQLKFSNDVSAETHCLVHFPSFIRLAREAGLEYVEIQNLTEFYDDNRAQLAGLLMNYVPNLLDPRGRLLPRSYDALGLYTTFIFQKPDPDITPPITTPLMQDASYNHDEVTSWRDDEMNGHVEPALGLGKISEQKGILGPGPADLRFPEAL